MIFVGGGEEEEEKRRSVLFCVFASATATDTRGQGLIRRVAGVHPSCANKLSARTGRRGGRLNQETSGER